MLDFFIALMRNIGLLALVALLYGAAIARLPKGFWPVALGLLCGAGAGIAIVDPTSLASDVPSDMRTALVLMASFFGGWVSAVIATAIAVAVRAFHSPQYVVVGIAILTMCGIVGVFGRQIVLRHSTRIGMKHIFLISLFSPLISLSVVTLPSDMILTVVRDYVLPANALRVLGLWVLGAMILHETLRVDAANKVRQLAYTDHLSGLANRRAFYAALDEAWASWKQIGEPFCVVMIDIDFFKRINDAHGHPAGDEVIRCLGKILNDERRVTDTVARLGGEEFAILLRAMHARDCLSFAERLRRRIEAQTIQLDSVSLHFTVSLGASRELVQCADRQDILSSADNALYAAKRDGRNRAVLDAGPDVQ